MGQEPERLRGAAAALQAHIRGYLVRKRFRSLQEEYESTVMEIEGGLDRLQWKGSLLPRPMFLQEKQVKAKRSIGQEAVSKDQSATDKEQQKLYALETLEPEKDCDSQGIANPAGQLEGEEVPLGSDAGGMRLNPQPEAETPTRLDCSLPGESSEWKNCSNVSSVWSSTILETGSARASQELSFGSMEKELPETLPELQRYRKHLAMEMLWLQQAIASLLDPETKAGGSREVTLLLYDPWIVGGPRGMRSTRLALPPHAKNVVVYRNGDPFFQGRKFVVNQRQFLTFEAFLNEVTSTIHAPVAVRNIYTPRQGHRVMELGELQNGCQYVAAGFERFKRLDYLNQGLKQLSGTRKKNGMQVRPVAPQKLTVSARWQKPARLPCVIHVFRNGDLLSPPFRLLLSKSTLLEWDGVLGLLTEKASLRSGAVRRLCRLDGVAVSSGEELVNGGYYVAVGTEKYKNLPYFELLVPENSAQRVFWSHPNNRRGIRNEGFSKFHATSQDGASDSALLEPPQQLDSRRVQSTGAAEKDETPVPSLMVRRPPRRYPHREEESVFHTKPTRAGQNKKSRRNTPHWLDQEEGGVYKVKDTRKEMRGAQEVAEDKHTMVELPVDQSAAETVEEEIIPKTRPTPHTKAGTTRRSQKALTTRNDSSNSEVEAN